jgi:hypothetical protein
MSNSSDFDKIPIRDYSVAHTPIPKKRNKHKILITLFVIVLVILAAIQLLGSKPKTKKLINTNVATSKTQVVTAPPSSASGKSSIYSSAYYNLTVSIPDSWTVTKNNKVLGRIVLSVTPTGQPPAGLKGKDAMEVLQSEKVVYTQPTSSQLGQSYISLVQYQSTLSSNGIDSVIVTGNSGYTKGQIVPFSKLNSLNPTIVIYFQSCVDSKCAAPTNLTINDSMWSDSNFSTTILNILKSFSLS